MKVKVRFTGTSKGASDEMVQVKDVLRVTEKTMQLKKVQYHLCSTTMQPSFAFVSLASIGRASRLYGQWKKVRKNRKYEVQKNRMLGQGDNKEYNCAGREVSSPRVARTEGHSRDLTEGSCVVLFVSTSS